MEEKKQGYLFYTEKEREQFLKEKQEQFGRQSQKQEKRTATSGAYYLDGCPFTTAWKKN